MNPPLPRAAEEAESVSAFEPLSEPAAIPKAAVEESSVEESSPEVTAASEGVAAEASGPLEGTEVVPEQAESKGESDQGTEIALEQAESNARMISPRRRRRRSNDKRLQGCLVG